MALYVRQDDNSTRQVIAIYKGTSSGPKVISAVYQGLTLLWGYIKSCFGRGFWINEKMWSNTDAWLN